MTSSGPGAATPDHSRWSAAAPHWHTGWATHFAPLWDRILGLVPIGAHHRVLDVGCGTGEFLRVAAGRGADVAGVDASAAMIALARHGLPDGAVRVAPAHTLPFPDTHFDLVLAVNVLEIAGDDALAELVRVTATGGRAVVANWAEDHLNDTEILERAVAERRGLTFTASGERRRAGALTRLLRDVGLTGIVETEMTLPYRAADDDALCGAVLLDRSGDALDRRALLEAARPFRGTDGTYGLRTAIRVAVGLKTFPPADTALVERVRSGRVGWTSAHSLHCATSWPAAVTAVSLRHVHARVSRTFVLGDLPDLVAAPR